MHHLYNIKYVHLKMGVKFSVNFKVCLALLLVQLTRRLSVTFWTIRSKLKWARVQLGILGRIEIKWTPRRIFGYTVRTCGLKLLYITFFFFFFFIILKDWSAKLIYKACLMVTNLSLSKLKSDNKVYFHKYIRWVELQLSQYIIHKIILSIRCLGEHIYSLAHTVQKN